VALRYLLALAATLAASMACREEAAARPTSGQHAPTRTTESASATDSHPSTIVPDNPQDRSIRRELNLAIDRDPDLKDRDLSFIVGNGDVSVTGVVGSESERERINAIALSISGVRSVANAVRVSP
jgi:osmotically-inducible protein OsmY